MKRKWLVSIICIIVLVCAGCGIYLFTRGNENVQAETGSEPAKVEYVHGQYVVDPEKTEELVGFSDHVFVGKVVKWLGNKQPDEGGFSIPYNEYEVEVLENLKGKLADKVVIQKMGGYNDKNVLILMGETDKKDKLPEVGKKYVFLAGVDEKGELLVDNAYAQKELGETGSSKTKSEIQKYKKAIQGEIVYKRERYSSKYKKK